MATARGENRKSPIVFSGVPARSFRIASPSVRNDEAMISRPLNSVIVYSAVSNLGNIGIKSSLRGPQARGNPEGRVDCHGPAALAMTQCEVVCVFGLFMYTKSLTAE
jgi:hypothetical protein